MFFDRIKLNYNIKVLEDYFQNKKYFESFKLLKSLEQNSKMFLDIFSYTYNNYLTQQTHERFFDKKFIWITGFDKDDTNLISNFLNFYISKSNPNTSYKFDSYLNFLNIIFKEYQIKDFENSYDFENVIQKSDFYQSLILLNQNKDYLFASTNAAFFEAQNKKYFIYPKSSLCFINIVSNPFKLYLRYKKNGLASQEALNFLCNHEIVFDENLKQIKDKDFLYIENKQNWNTNIKSWIDVNVSSTFRGKHVNHDRFLDSPQENFLEILYHIKQSGMNIDIKYDLVDQYLKDNANLFDQEDVGSISNNELKTVSNLIDKKLLEEFNF